VVDHPSSGVWLSDADRGLADMADDIRRRRVVDNWGNKIGTVEDLLIDTEENKVRLLLLEHGGVIGFGAAPSILPVEAVMRVSDEEVVIEQPRDRIAGAPQYNATVSDQTGYYGSVYKYYGYRRL
jgi:sporulation protein YlmC with PRC-barrel domain